jgi:hypothetical protein
MPPAPESARCRLAPPRSDEVPVSSRTLHGGLACVEVLLRVYATLASPTLRTAYDEAMGKMRRQFTLTPAGRPIIPDKISWLHSEMLKTRVAHGYCSRHQAAGACPYANICETCDNFVTGPEFAPALRDQLTDVQDLHADAQSRGWDSEAARHARVINALTDHLTRLQR